MANKNDIPAEELPEESDVPAESNENTPDNRDAEIARLKEELAVVRDKWVRAVAEGENMRKRAKREQEEMSKYAIAAFARDMVSVLENLMRASGNIPAVARAESELFKTLANGVDLTRDELLNIFEKYAIKRIDPLGEKFDHNFHQAVVQIEKNEVEPGTVLEVVQAGYTIHDRLLRPAMVAVSRRSEAPPEGSSVDTLV